MKNMQLNNLNSSLRIKISPMLFMHLFFRYSIKFYFLKDIKIFCLKSFKNSNRYLNYY